MREIKFRVWDKEEKDMSFWPDGVLNGNYFSECLKDKDMVVMQFTGLKDRKDKEIFEGDVVRCYHEKVEIVSYFGAFGFWRTRDNFSPLMDIWERGNGHHVEIISNIYENPELLNN